MRVNGCFDFEFDLEYVWIMVKLFRVCLNYG